MCPRWFRLLFCFLLIIILGFTTAVFSATESTEKILLLYKKRDPDHKGIVQLFGGFLKEAGYGFDIQDAEELLTQNPDMSPYIGIMTTYQSTHMVGADRYPRWLVEQMEAGRRILIVGSYGAYQGLLQKPDGSLLEWNESTQAINTFFYPFGLEFYFAFTQDNSKLKITRADKDFAQFQTSITQEELTHFQLFKSVNDQNRIFFELERTDMPDSRSALNVITPFGGMIHEGYSYFWDQNNNKNVFRVDFTSFVKEVFSGVSPTVPKIDIQTHANLLQQHPLPRRDAPTQWQQLRSSEIDRKILVLYKKSEAKSLKKLPFYDRAALILEYLGLIPVYWAVEDGLPNDRMMEDFRGIATWHTKSHMHDAQKYGEWMLHQIENGKRIAILQEYGADFDLKTQEPTSNREEVMAALGIEFVVRPERREEHEPSMRLMDQSMIAFERELPAHMVTYDNTYTSTDSRNKVFLSFNDRDYGVVDLGVITPKGGLCLEQSPFYFPPQDVERVALVRSALEGEVAPEVAEQPTLGAWYLNPFRFFSEAFGLHQFPAPDVTTLNGSRIFYTHIDGDGLESISQIDRVHMAGSFVYEDILKKYDEIPFTVSVITKPIENLGNQYYRPSVKLAQKIFYLPNVDVAVHTATHPFNWTGGDPYILNHDAYPIKIGHQAHDLLEEIWGAKLFVDHNLVPLDKKTTSLFWSGETNPDQKALEIVWRAGMHNINGGDPRYDDEYPSIAGLVSYSTPYPPYRQYLTSAQNDYYYSLFLTGDWGGQKKLLQHFENTDKPYRVYPMNLYYHFYAGIRNESMEALKYLYDYVLSLDTANIFASQYLDILEDYYNTHIGFDGHAYWVENNGSLRTIRFNNILHVDMRHSDGVIGYSHNDNQTYVHLDDSKQRKIHLGKSFPTVPYIIQATQFVDSLEYTGGQVKFIYRGFGKTLLKIGGLKPATDYQLTLIAKGKEPISKLIKTDHNGIAEYRAVLKAPQTTYSGILEQRGGF